MKQSFYAGMFALTSTVSSAQTINENLDIYGLLDIGFNSVSNVDDAQKTLDNRASGIYAGDVQGNRVGFNINYPLFKNTKFIGTVEYGFIADNYTSGRDWYARPTFAGFTGNWGTLTYGRQYDFIGDYFPGYANAAISGTGLMGWALPLYAAGGFSLDNRISGNTEDNAVKYLSPNLNGYQIGVYWSDEDRKKGGQSRNIYMSYNHDNISVAASSSQIKNFGFSGDDVKEYALGGSYTQQKLTYYGNITHVEFQQKTATTLDTGINLKYDEHWLFSLGTQYQKRNQNVNSAQALLLHTSYYVTPKIDIYGIYALNHDQGFKATVHPLMLSSEQSIQHGTRIGVRIKF